MCGISGLIEWGSNSGKEAVRRMTEAIHHRGPDDEGYFSDQFGDTNLHFGFKRLSIIDLSESGHQPMVDDLLSKVIVFNGEIYNYREIRKELEVAGHTFRSGSDTEVILKSYSEWGASCLDRFIGMFAFVIYDSKNKKLFGARDRMGVKPFFYHLSDDRLIFCSELKGIKASGVLNLTLDMNSAGDYLKYGHSIGRRTIYKEIEKLLPGHYFLLDLSSKKFETACYWSYDTFGRNNNSDLTYDETRSQLEALLLSAFSYRMVADVPVGIFLSGGIDSSLLAAVLAKKGGFQFDSFTIGFQESDYDESAHAAAIAGHLGIRHHIQMCTAHDAMDLMGSFYSIYDEPFGDTSGIPTFMVSQFASRHSKVALSADGSDEIFAGYTKYQKALKYLSYKNKLTSVPFAASAVSALLGNGSDIALHNRKLRLKKYLSTTVLREGFDIITCGMIDEEVRSLINFDYRNVFPELMNDVGNDPLLNFSSYDVQSYLCGDILYKVDMASMHTSLEVREPFLDHRILEFAASMPAQFKLNGNSGKWILKQILGDLIPEEMFNRPKQGFSIPLEKWCRNELKPLFMEVLSDQKIAQSGVFNHESVIKIRNAFVNNRPMDFQRLFRIFSFLLWQNRN